MIPTKKRTLSPLPCLLLGALPGIPLIFPAWHFSAFFLSIPLLLYLYYMLFGEEPPGHRRVWLCGGFAMTGYFLTVFHWLFGMYPLAFIPDMTPLYAGVIVSLCWFLLSLLQGVSFAPAFLLLSFLSRRPLVRRAPVLFGFLYAALYTLFEWGQNFTWMGVPWGGQMLGQMENAPLLGVASLFGAHYITFVILAVNGLFAYGLWKLRRLKKSHPTPLPLRCYAAFCGAILIFLGNLAAGGLALLRRAPTGEPVRVAVVQTNHASLDKTQASNIEIWDVAKDLAAAAAEDGADCILYSETILTVDLESSPYYRWELQNLSRQYGVVQIIGGYHYEYDEEGNRLFYNALYYIDETGAFSETIYDKRHLVPFGEYLPWDAFFETVFPFITELLREAELSPGEATNNFAGSLGDVGALICFDSIYPALTTESVRDGADFMVLATNDSWFAGTAALRQHTSHATLRAIESGRYLARTAATGESMVITPTGAHTAVVPESTRGYAIGDVYPTSQMTLYTQIGDLFPILCGVWILAAFVYRPKEKN